MSTEAPASALEGSVFGAHLVGSVNLLDAEAVFRAAARHLGGQLRRIPDGEVGERYRPTGSCSRTSATPPPRSTPTPSSADCGTNAPRDTSCGVATECGFGRGPSERTAPLLDLHREIAEAHQG